MEKDRTYYQQVAEKYYLSQFAEIKEKKDKENAELEAWRKKLYEKEGTEYHEDELEEDYYTYVNVNVKDETCFMPEDHIKAVRQHELLFVCKMKEGMVVTHFVKDGKDKIAEMLGLVDMYDKNERIDVDYVRKEDGVLHLDLPDELQKYSKSFFKVKLYGLDNFVSECNYTGWGDCFTNNVLEIIAGLLNQDCIDFEKNEIHYALNWYVGPGDEEEMNYYAQFEFSHCEVAKGDGDDDETNWVIFICYNYNGLQEYEEE